MLFRTALRTADRSRSRARALDFAIYPRSLRGRLETAVSHPFTVGGALLRSLRR
jgi:hypothetical protein